MSTVKDEIGQLLIDLDHTKNNLDHAKNNKFIKNVVLDPDAIFRLLEDAWDTIDDLERIIAKYEEEGH